MKCKSKVNVFIYEYIQFLFLHYGLTRPAITSDLQYNSNHVKQINSLTACALFYVPIKKWSGVVFMRQIISWNPVQSRPTIFIYSTYERGCCKLYTCKSVGSRMIRWTFLSFSMRFIPPIKLCLAGHYFPCLSTSPENIMFIHEFGLFVRFIRIFSVLELNWTILKWRYTKHWNYEMWSYEILSGKTIAV